MVNLRREYQYLKNSIQPETVALAPPAARRVLDIGGGTGAFTAVIMERCGAHFGAVVDVSEEAVQARVAGVTVGAVLDVEQDGALEAFMAKHGPFDLVLCLDVLEHLVDPRKVVERLHGCLPMNGHILASIPNVQNYRVVLRSFLGTWHYRESGLFDRTHLRFFSRRSAQALMTGSGLDLIAAGVAYGPVPRDRHLSRLSCGVLDPWLAMQNLFLVQKRHEQVTPMGFFGRNVANS